MSRAEQSSPTSNPLREDEPVVQTVRRLSAEVESQLAGCCESLHALGRVLDQQPDLQGYLAEALQKARAARSALAAIQHVPDASGPQRTPVGAELSVARPMSVSVLIVDDDETVLRWLGRLVRGAGARVTTAASALEALQLIDSGTVAPDVVVADVRMDGISGPDLAAQLSKRSPSMPVLLISALRPPPSGLERGERRSFLLKPFSGDELLAAIQGLLEPCPARAGQ